MDKETFRQSVREWTNICNDAAFIIKGEGTKNTNEDRNLSLRYIKLYNKAQTKIAPIIFAAAALHTPYSTHTLIFDSLPLTLREQKDYQEKVQAAFAERKAQPLFVDLNYFDKNESLVIGLRLIDKGDGEKFVKVVNAPEFYINKDANDFYYGAVNVEDKNGMNILTSRIADYFHDKSPKAPHLS